MNQKTMLEKLTELFALPNILYGVDEAHKDGWTKHLDVYALKRDQLT